MSTLDSQQVSWWETHLFLKELVAHYSALPLAGTPCWCALDDSDPRKLISLAVEGEHHVLRKETAQEARANASNAVAGSADWSAIARKVNQHSGFYTKRPWLKRVNR